MLLGLVRLLHVDQLFLQAAVLPQELLQLGGVVLEAVGVRRAATTASLSTGSGTVTPGGEASEDVKG